MCQYVLYSRTGMCCRHKLCASALRDLGLGQQPRPSPLHGELIADSRPGRYPLVLFEPVHLQMLPSDTSLAFRFKCDRRCTVLWQRQAVDRRDGTSVA
jgi:hypothetical protein